MTPMFGRLPIVFVFCAITPFVVMPAPGRHRVGAIELGEPHGHLRRVDGDPGQGAADVRDQVIVAGQIQGSDQARDGESNP